MPIIDLAPLHGGDDAGLRAVAAEIRRAAEEVGFFYVAGHGIDPALQRRAQETAHAFFARPEAEKRRVAVDQRNRGFLAMGDCKLPGAEATDLKEVFFWGPEADPDDPAVLAGLPLTGPNNWPADMPELQQAVWPYYRAVMDCGAGLLRAIAVSLDLAPDFFERRYRRPLGRGQLVFYPPHPLEAEVPNFGAAPHCDFGCLTLLLQDDNGGLEIRDLSGAWVPGSARRGDAGGQHRRPAGALEQRPLPFDPAPPWSTAPAGGGCRSRSSTIPDSDAVIDPRDMGLPAGVEPRYAPVAAGDYIMSRNRLSFAHYAEAEA